jgi:hypothetical protein
MHNSFLLKFECMHACTDKHGVVFFLVLSFSTLDRAWGQAKGGVVCGRVGY